MISGESSPSDKYIEWNEELDALTPNMFLKNSVANNLVNQLDNIDKDSMQK